MAGSARAIPPALLPDVIAKAGEGLTTRQIAEWLANERGVEVGYVTVSRELKRARTERADVAKVVLRERLSSSLTTDIDRLEHFARRAAEMADARADQDDADGFAKLVTVVEKLTATKLKFSGAEQPDDPNADLAAAAERVVGRLAAAVAEQGGDPGDTDDDGAGGA